MKIKKSPVYRLSLSELEQNGKHQTVPTTKTMKNLFQIQSFPKFNLSAIIDDRQQFTIYNQYFLALVNGLKVWNNHIDQGVLTCKSQYKKHEYIYSVLLKVKGSNNQQAQATLKNLYKWYKNYDQSSNENYGFTTELLEKVSTKLKRKNKDQSSMVRLTFKSSSKQNLRQYKRKKPFNSKKHLTDNIESQPNSCLTTKQQNRFSVPGLTNFHKLNNKKMLRLKNTQDIENHLQQWKKDKSLLMESFCRATQQEPVLALDKYYRKECQPQKPATIFTETAACFNKIKRLRLFKHQYHKSLNHLGNEQQPIKLFHERLKLLPISFHQTFDEQQNISNNYSIVGMGLMSNPFQQSKKKRKK